MSNLKVPDWAAKAEQMWEAGMVDSVFDDHDTNQEHLEDAYQQIKCIWLKHCDNVIAKFPTTTNNIQPSNYLVDLNTVLKQLNNVVLKLDDCHMIPAANPTEGLEFIHGGKRFCIVANSFDGYHVLPASDNQSEDQNE